MKRVLSAAMLAVVFLLAPIAPASASGSPLCEYTVHHGPVQIDTDGNRFSLLNRLDFDTRNCAGVLAFTMFLSPFPDQPWKLAVLPGVISSIGRGQLSKLGLWKIPMYGGQGQPYPAPFTDPCTAPGFVPDFVLAPAPHPKIEPANCPG